jgi:hypothetical protein
MAEMTGLEKSLLEDIIDADQHLNPETSETYASIRVLCKKIITINTRFGLANSPAIEAVAKGNGHDDSDLEPEEAHQKGNEMLLPDGLCVWNPHGSSQHE